MMPFLILTLVMGVMLHSGEHVWAKSATATISEGLDNAAEGSYDQNVTASVFIGNLIRTLLGATGLIFLVLIVYAGILYMIAAGDTDKVKKAKSMITTSIIGLIIIIGAYAIASYVVNALSEASVNETSTGT